MSFLCSLYLQELVIIDLKLLETHVNVRLLVLHMCRETGSVGVYPRDFFRHLLKILVHVSVACLRQLVYCGLYIVLTAQRIVCERGICYRKHIVVSCMHRVTVT